MLYRVFSTNENNQKVVDAPNDLDLTNASELMGFLTLMQTSLNTKVTGLFNINIRALAENECVKADIFVIRDGNKLVLMPQ